MYRLVHHIRGELGWGVATHRTCPTAKSQFAFRLGLWARNCASVSPLSVQTL